MSERAKLLRLLQRPKENAPVDGLQGPLSAHTYYKRLGRLLFQARLGGWAVGVYQSIDRVGRALTPKEFWPKRDRKWRRSQYGNCTSYNPDGCAPRSNVRRETAAERMLGGGL